MVRLTRSSLLTLLCACAAFGQVGIIGGGSGSGSTDNNQTAFAGALKADLTSNTLIGVTRIAVLGDSLSYCTHDNCSTTFSTTLWVNLMRSYLQGLYGNHGTGIMPFRAHVDTTSTNPDVVASVTGGAAGGCDQNTPMQAAAGGDVIGQACVSIVTPGLVITSTAHTYDHATFLFQFCCNTTGVDVHIDGTDLGTIANYALGDCCFPATSMLAAPGGLASHTFTLTLNAGASPSAYFFGFDGTIGSTGVSVDNISTGSARTEWYSPLNGSSGNTHTALAIPMQIWQANTAHTFFIIPLGTNDYINSNETSYGGFLGTMIQSLLDAGFSASHILVVSPPYEGPFNSTVTVPNDQSQYTATAQRLATQYNTSYLNVCKIDSSFCSFHNANAAGYMMSDVTHMTAAGQTAWWTAIKTGLRL